VDKVNRPDLRTLIHRISYDPFVDHGLILPAPPFNCMRLLLFIHDQKFIRPNAKWLKKLREERIQRQDCDNLILEVQIFNSQ
jgi:hypothetical protein